MHHDRHKPRITNPKSDEGFKFIQLWWEMDSLTSVEGHELIDILLAHSYPLAKSSDSHGRCDCLPTIAIDKRAAGIVHDAPIVVGANKGGASGIFLFKITLCSRPDVLPIDSDILIPVTKIILTIVHNYESANVSVHLSVLDCSCHIPSACNISCSIVPEPVQPLARFSSCLPNVLPT